MTVNLNTVISFAAVLTALITIFGTAFAVYRWFLKQNKQDADIKHMKEENTLIVYALSACLDGLQQLGANHNVTTVKEKLDKYINQQAHR